MAAKFGKDCKNQYCQENEKSMKVPREKKSLEMTKVIKLFLVCNL